MDMTEAEILKSSILLKAWNIVMDCDMASSAQQSLLRLAMGYKRNLPGLSHFRGQDSDRLSIYREFKECVQESKVVL